MKNRLALLYHEVINDYTESGFQNNDNLAYMHKTEVFEKQIEIFKNHVHQTNSSKIDDYLFTFDDGGISNLRAASILEKNNLIGQFFITTKQIGNKGFLSPKDIIQLHKNGHIIGSHSHTHPMIFRTLSYAKMLEEWKVSKQILEEIIEQKVFFFFFTGGDANKKTFEYAAEAGFHYIYVSEHIIATRTFNTSEIIGRLSIKANLTDEQFLKTLELKNLSALQRNRKIKSTIKKIIFPLHQYIQNKKNG